MIQRPEILGPFSLERLGPFPNYLKTFTGYWHPGSFEPIFEQYGVIIDTPPLGVRLPLHNQPTQILKKLFLTGEL